MTRDDLLKRLADADIAFAEVNTMADLAVHPHLRRIEVDTPKGKVSYAAPAAIFVGETAALWRGARASASIPNFRKLLAPGPNRHDRSTREKLDLDHLRQWIGRSTEASDIVTAQLVKGLRATLFQEIGEPKPGDAAPWTVHWCLAQPVFPMSQLGPDGHPTRGGFLPPVPLPRRMWAGGELEFFDAAARRRRGEAHLAHLGRDDEDRQHRRAVLRLRRAHDHDAARHRDPRAAGHRLSRHGERAAGGAGQAAPRRRRSQNIAKATWPIPCCCFAIRR